MEPVNPGESVVGGLSMKVNLDLDPGGAKRMDLAVTTGGGGKSVLLYAFGTLICDNRNTHQGGLGEETNDAFNTTDPVVIDLYGDRNYVAVYINEKLVIENILPLEGKGVFGLRSSSSAVRYTDLYIEELGDTLLDGRERYYPQTFETEEPPAGTEAPGPGPLPWILGGTVAAALAVLAAAVFLLRRKRKG